jgi:hypothetical protein
MTNGSMNLLRVLGGKHTIGANPMPSSDERIQQIIARKKAQTEADQLEKNLAIEQQTAKDKRLADLRAKWAADTHVIDASIKDIQQKVAGFGVKMTFQHAPGNPGTTIGVAAFSGSSPNTVNGAMSWNVHEDGVVNVFYERLRSAPGTKGMEAPVKSDAAPSGMAKLRIVSTRTISFDVVRKSYS